MLTSTLKLRPVIHFGTLNVSMAESAMAFTCGKANTNPKQRNSNAKQWRRALGQPLATQPVPDNTWARPTSGRSHPDPTASSPFRCATGLPSPKRSHPASRRAPGPPSLLGNPDDITGTNRDDNARYTEPQNWRHHPLCHRVWQERRRADAAKRQTDYLKQSQVRR